MLSGTATAQSPSRPVPLVDTPGPVPNIDQLVPPVVTPNPQAEDQAIYDSYHALDVACFNKGGTMSGVTCVPPPPPPPPVTNSPESAQTPVVTAHEDQGSSEPQGVTLIGQLGWSTPTGNCVDEPGVNNPGWGNPIDWPVLTSTPAIGESALFYFNHVAVVTGIWSNGDIEVAQENSPGAPHTYPPSEIRGYR